METLAVKLFMEETLSTSPPPTRSQIGVLVVEDEPAIGSLLELALTPHGFTVWTATGGREALELFRQHADEISLALLDVQMPGLDGPETFRALRALRPDLICCFMSGSTGDYTAQSLLELGATKVFSKPFSLKKMALEFWQIAGHPERRREARLATNRKLVLLGGLQAWLRDLSAGGLGLDSTSPFPLGTVLGLRFEDGTNSDYFVEVRYCRRDGGDWIVGCKFVAEPRGDRDLQKAPPPLV
jgi:two-component system, OmpR family, response regulator